MSLDFEYRFLPTDAPILIPDEMTEFKCLILIERQVAVPYHGLLADYLSKVAAGSLWLGGLRFPNGMTA